MKRSAAVAFKPFRPLLAMALIAATLGGCDAANPERFPDPRHTGLPAPTTVALPGAVPPTPTLAAANASSVHAATSSAPNGPTTGNAQALVAPANTSPLDVTSRLVALERWAQELNGSLDVVSTAMVDPDESVRERAQQLFEEALARRH